MKRTLIFYGDSNTWGYDPASFTDGRYPVDKIWTTLLQKELGRDWEIIPQGLNGRTLPVRQEDLDRVGRMAAGLGPDDVFGIMLGTNDVGRPSRPDAAVPIVRMQRLLQMLTLNGNPKILVIAPPWIGGSGAADPVLEPYREQCRRMNATFAELAAQYGAFYADAAEWNIGLAFDFIHFSLAGHRQFAYSMKEVMELI